MEQGKLTDTGRQIKSNNLHHPAAGRAFGFIIGSFRASKACHYVFSVIKAKTKSPAEAGVKSGYS